MSMQASKPRVVVKLWKCQIEQPKLNQADPSIIIFDKGTSMYHVLVFSLQISHVKCLFVILATCLLIWFPLYMLKEELLNVKMVINTELYCVT